MPADPRLQHFVRLSTFNYVPHLEGIRCILNQAIHNFDTSELRQDVILLTCVDEVSCLIQLSARSVLTIVLA